MKDKKKRKSGFGRQEGGHSDRERQDEEASCGLRPAFPRILIITVFPLYNFGYAHASSARVYLCEWELLLFKHLKHE